MMKMRQPLSVLERRSFLGTLALGTLFVLSGCDTTDAFLTPEDAPHVTETPCQVVATWQPNVMFAADPMHNGAQNAGLAGRVYLFGPVMKDSLVGDGTLTVDLFDGTPQPDGKGPVMVERWNFDADSLKRSLKRDPIGWGYTLFLPSARLTPQMTRVELKVRYNPPKGTPLFSDSGVITVNGPQQPQSPVPQVSRTATGSSNAVSQVSHTATPRGQ